MKNNTLFTLLIVAVIGIGATFFILNRPQAPTPDSQERSTTETQSQKVAGYSGNLLAGSTTPYIEFNSADYERAKSEGKIIFLDFYANWCPICRAEAPDIHAGFDGLNRPDVVGFRVNYNDTETDETEKALAQEFGVTYQHTKVILKNGEQILKNGEVWDRDRVVEEIGKVQ